MADNDQPPAKRQKNLFGLLSPATPGLLLTQMPTPSREMLSNQQSSATKNTAESTLDVSSDGDVVLMVDSVGGSTTP
jgi:hypothetical protein